MFGASIIVFRESLEAALLIGIIAAATRGLAGRNRWLTIGVSAGLFGSLLIAGFTEYIGQLADGRGQELFNAGILGAAVFMLGWHNVWMASHGVEMARKAKAFGIELKNGTQGLSTIAVIVGLAVLREGAETVLFLYGMSSEGSLVQVMLGGLVGLAAGVSLGAVIYFGLLRIPVRWFFSATAGLILLVAAGLAAQMAKFLVQGDWLPPLATPLWDSSTILPMKSFLGSTLHILLGYEAQPSGMQVIFYLTTLVVIAVGSWWVRTRQDSLSSFKLKTL